MTEIAETETLVPPVTETPVEQSLVTGAEALKTEEPPAVEKTAEELAAEATAAEEAAALAAPITVEDVVLPEGFAPLSDDLMKEFVDTINNSDLGPKARAEALIQLQAKAMTAASEASSAAWTNLQEEWRTEVKTQLGDRLQPTLDSINNLVTEHGDAKLIEALAITGAGNNPEVIKFLATVSNLLTEGKFTAGSPNGQEKTAAQRLYPSMPN